MTMFQLDLVNIDVAAETIVHAWLARKVRVTNETIETFIGGISVQETYHKIILDFEDVNGLTSHDLHAKILKCVHSTHTYYLERAKPTVKFGCRRVKLNNEGYDNNGAYWGNATPLYCAMAEDGSETYYTRATSRNLAKHNLKKEYPGIEFLR